MEDWLVITVLLIGLIVFAFLVVWIDGVFKRRKTIKKFEIDTYIAGFAIIKQEDDSGRILVLNGLLGFNSQEMVFGHHFKDDSFYFKEELSNISYFYVSEYNEFDFLNYVQKKLVKNNVKLRFIVVTQAGISITKRVPKIIKKRMLCKIGFKNDSVFTFCYENNNKNMETIQKLRKSYIQGQCSVKSI